MNEDTLKGKWNEIRGEIQKKWGELTDDDLDKAEGQHDKMVGLLQQKYGYARDKAEKEYDEFTSTWSRSGV